MPNQQISERWNKPLSRNVTYLTGAGDEVVIAQPLCNTCGNYIRASEPHAQCISQRREEIQMKEAEIRKEQCIQKYGEVLSQEQEMRRDYPDYKVEGYSETWNQQLAREKREAEATRLKVIRDRAERKKMLEQMKNDIKILERQITRDNEEEQEEKAQGVGV